MAEMKLIVHGVPNGQQTWGMDADDENYINQFYTGGSDGASVNMLVEVRQSGGRQYCYYTYRKNGTVDAQGRSGGYFALSLRMDYYHSDVVGIYYLLDRFYKKCIDGSLLIATEGKVKFAKADFASYGSLFEGIRAKLADIVSTISKNSYAVPLAGFASNGQNKAFEANLLDCEDMENVKAYVKKGGKMCVSATCPRGREKKQLDAKEAEYEKKLGDIQKEAQESKQKLEQEISDLKRQSEQTRSDLRRELEEKKTEITKLGKELETFKRNATSLFSQLEGAIKGGMDQLSLSRKNIVSPPPVREVAPVCRETVDRPRPQRSNRLLSVLNLILTIVLLALFAYQMFMGNGFAMGKEQIISAKNEEIKGLKTNVADLEKQNKNLKEAKSKQAESSTSTSVNDSDEWMIDVENYAPNEPMSVGKQYKVSVKKKGGTASNLSGEWHSPNGDFNIVKPNGSTAEIIPQKAGSQLSLKFESKDRKFVSRDNLVAK